MDGPSVPDSPPSGYLRKLLWLLVFASFLQGYDLGLLALLLPNIQSAFHAREALLGLVRIPIELGLVAAFFVARLSDRYGRRPLLLWSMSGYTACTALTASAGTIWSFGVLQFGARVFLGTALAVAVTVIVEEFPVERRGPVLGIVLAFDLVGTTAVALLLAAGLQRGPLGWRMFFLLGLAGIPLFFFARRGLHETHRFLERNQNQGWGWLLAAWHPPFRRILCAVGVVHLLRSIPLFGAIAWWAFFAERERGLTESEVAVAFMAASVAGCLGYYCCGQLMGRIGLRPTAIIYLSSALATTVVLFQTHDEALGFLALSASVAFGPGAQPVLSAFASELFPTEVRGQAVAWIRGWFEAPGFVLGPAAVGLLGDHVKGAVGNIGGAVTLLVLVAVPTPWLVWRYLPEPEERQLKHMPN